MAPFMPSFWPFRGNSDDGSYENARCDGCASTKAPALPNMNSIGVDHIDWYRPYTDRRKHLLEHSFSDISQLHVDARDADNIGPANDMKPKGIRADFVHLLGANKLHSKENPTIGLDVHEEKEGFQLRSIHRSVSSVETGREFGECVLGSTKTIVVVPSLDLDTKELEMMCTTIEYYEERQLYHLFLANDPSVRIVYITSNYVDEKVVGYYLGLAQNEDYDEHLKSDRLSGVHEKLTRVFMISVPSKERIPLSDKVVEDKNLIEFVRGLINGGRHSLPSHSAGLSANTGSDAIDKLSTELGIRLLEASADHLHFGTKQGSREIFAACGIPHAAGTPSSDDDDLLTYSEEYEDRTAYWADKHRYIRSPHSLAVGIARQIIRGARPRKWMVKLNQGFSGKGNATIDLKEIQDRIYSSNSDVEKQVLEMAAEIEKELENMKFEDPSHSWRGDITRVGFCTQIERLGVIAEAFIEGEVPTSPSVQVVIEPSGDSAVGGRVSIVSTHEQLLRGQVYQGCVNPCNQEYRPQIMDMGQRIGQYLAARGVVGHFSCDFMAARNADGSWDINAVEVNLRQGGTTHPHATMALLCGGCICSDGVFRTNDNEVRTYVATDCHSIRPISEGRLVDAIQCKTDPLARRIRWDKKECVGVVFHLFKFATTGRIGFTAIGKSIAESQHLFDLTVEFLSKLE